MPWSLEWSLVIAIGVLCIYSLWLGRVVRRLERGFTIHLPEPMDAEQARQTGADLMRFLEAETVKPILDK